MEFVQSSSSSMLPPPIRPNPKRTASMVSLPTPPGTEDLTVLDADAHDKGEGGSKADKRKAAAMEAMDEDDPFAAPTSSNRTVRPVKRTRFSGVDSSDEEEDRAVKASSEDDMESPSNPFKVKAGERIRRSEEGMGGHPNQITYVFRGKRIHYDAPQDIVLPGDSPFAGGIKPKLLFPSPPSPPPKLSFASSSSNAHGFGLITPDVDSDLVMQTPVKKRGNDQDRARCPLPPTPQSRPRPVIRR